MWLMLQQDTPDDYVLATGVPATVRDFCREAFAHAELDWEKYVRIDAKYQRPAEVPALVGNAAKAAEKLGWKPRFDWCDVARRMTDADIALLDDERSGRNVRIDR